MVLTERYKGAIPRAAIEPIIGFSTRTIRENHSMLIKRLQQVHHHNPETEADDPISVSGRCGSKRACVIR